MSFGAAAAAGRTVFRRSIHGRRCCCPERDKRRGGRGADRAACTHAFHRFAAALGGASFAAPPRYIPHALCTHKAFLVPLFGRTGGRQAYSPGQPQRGGGFELRGWSRAGTARGGTPKCRVPGARPLAAGRNRPGQTRGRSRPVERRAGKSLGRLRPVATAEGRREAACGRGVGERRRPWIAEPPSGGRATQTAVVWGGVTTAVGQVGCASQSKKVCI